MTSIQRRRGGARAGRPVFVILGLLGASLAPSSAHSQVDGHGPDAWQVDGVAADDVLNARIGPGTNYPVIATFAHDERGLQQVTCVPLATMEAFQALTPAQRNSLPPPWCLMRSADLSRTGWVLQRYLIGDGYEPVDSPTTGPGAIPEDAMVDHAVDLVRALYERADLATRGGPDPLDPANAGDYFSSEVVAAMQAEPLQADPVFGAQDFEGSFSEPEPDPDQPVLRGMITLTVRIVNFGRPHTAVIRLRADTSRPGAPIRIFRIEHDGWSFP